MYRHKRKLFTVLTVTIFLGVVGFLSFHQISKRQSVFLGADLCIPTSESDSLPEDALPHPPGYWFEVHEVTRTGFISSDFGEVYPRSGTDFILIDVTLHARKNPISIDVENIELKNVKYDRKCRVYNLGDRRPLGLEEDIASGVIGVKGDSKKRAVFVFEVPHEFEPGNIGVGWLNFGLGPRD